MQQTEKYQLNLIDPSDDFSPEPLNENARALETQLSAHETAIGSGGKTARIAFGSYVGNNEYGKEHPNVLTFDFKPVLVILVGHVLIRGFTSSMFSGGFHVTLTWGENSVSWYQGNGAGYQENAKDVTYSYVAIGESLN